MRPIGRTPPFCAVVAYADRMNALLLTVVLADPWSCEVTADAITMRSGRASLRYQVALKSPPEGVDPLVAGSGFLHPVTTPGGRTVTADFPADYPHQHGLFYAWTKTEFRGHEVDFWNAHRGLGRVEHDPSQPVEVLPGRGFRAHLNHDDRTTDPPTVAMREVRTYAPLVTRVAGVDVLLIEVESVLTAATADPVTLRTHVYGGFAIRGPDAWVESARFLTPDGADRLAGNHRRYDWAAMTGPAGNGPATIGLIGPRSNLRSPQPVRLHPTMPYLCFSPTVERPLAVSREQPLELRYVYAAYDGEPDDPAALWAELVRLSSSPLSSSPLRADRPPAP